MKDDRKFIELSKEERKEKSRKLLFGDYKDEYLGNIWGWKFSMISFIGLLFVGALAFYGIKTGKIDLEQLDKEQPSIFSTIQKRQMDPKKDSL